jgi:hypothetical protein
MRIFTRLALPALFALVAGVACTTTQLPPAHGFEEALGVYRLSSGKKALAVAVDEKGRKEFSVLYGAWRQKSANEKALAFCNQKAARRGIEAQCYLFAVGDAAAPSTLRGCAEGWIGERRCALQKQYPLGGR